jgi:hypothetical protein
MINYKLPHGILEDRLGDRKNRNVSAAKNFFSKKVKNYIKPLR